jgi:hypothetical protein
MKKNAFFILTVLLLAGTMLFACARDENEEQPGAIEKFTDDTAKEIVDSIKKPLNKAHSAKDTGQDRMKDIDDAIQQ